MSVEGAALNHFVEYFAGLLCAMSVRFHAVPRCLSALAEGKECGTRADAGIKDACGLVGKLQEAPDSSGLGRVQRVVAQLELCSCSHFRFSFALKWDRSRAPSTLKYSLDKEAVPGRL
jgi:hypothetical protein